MASKEVESRISVEASNEEDHAATCSTGRRLSRDSHVSLSYKWLTTGVLCLEESLSVSSGRIRLREYLSTLSVFRTP